jgi:predicted Zn finger-like uncharacterized protein
MRLTCPACDATYDVPDRLIGPDGRKLRCAKCGTQWTARRESAEAPVSPALALPEPVLAAEPVPPTGWDEAPGEPAPPAPPIAQPPPRPVPAPRPPREAPALAAPGVEEPPKPGPNRALRLAWAGTAAALIALVVALVRFQAEVTAAWPPAARLYLAVGLGG